jgi:hypothetical protein
MAGINFAVHRYEACKRNERYYYNTENEAINTTAVAGYLPAAGRQV